MNVIRNTEIRTKVNAFYKKVKVNTIKIIDVIENEINYLKQYWEFVKADTTAECKIPMSVFDALARVLLPDITAFFESEEGKKNMQNMLTPQKRLSRKKPAK